MKNISWIYKTIHNLNKGKLCYEHFRKNWCSDYCPSGSSAAALLRKKGYKVGKSSISHDFQLVSHYYRNVFRRGRFTRNSSRACRAIQFKNGAAFLRGKQRSFYVKNLPMGRGRLGRFAVPIFTCETSSGLWGRPPFWTWDVDVAPEQPILTVLDENPIKFKPSSYLMQVGLVEFIVRFRESIKLSSTSCTVYEDGITDDPEFDRNKILIMKKTTVHGIGWFHLLMAERCSGWTRFFWQIHSWKCCEPEAMFKRILADEPSLSDVKLSLIHQYVLSWVTLPAFGRPQLCTFRKCRWVSWFSSGVTIALKSSSLAVPCVFCKVNR